MGLLLILSTGLAPRDQVFPHLINGTDPGYEGESLRIYRGYSAPYRGLPDAAFNGYRRFPLSIPVRAYANGNGAAQTHHYHTQLNWQKPVHFIWGIEDDVFEEAWGRKWASQMNASFDPVAGAGHFLQSSHGAEVASHLLRRISEE